MRQARCDRISLGEISASYVARYLRGRIGYPRQADSGEEPRAGIPDVRKREALISRGDSAYLSCGFHDKGIVKSFIHDLNLGKIHDRVGSRFGHAQALFGRVVALAASTSQMEQRPISEIIFQDEVDGWTNLSRHHDDESTVSDDSSEFAERAEKFMTLEESDDESEDDQISRDANEKMRELDTSLPTARARFPEPHTSKSSIGER